MKRMEVVKVRKKVVEAGIKQINVGIQLYEKEGNDKKEGIMDTETKERRTKQTAKHLRKRRYTVGFAKKDKGNGCR